MNKRELVELYVTAESDVIKRVCIIKLAEIDPYLFDKSK